MKIKKYDSIINPEASIKIKIKIKSKIMNNKLINKLN